MKGATDLRRSNSPDVADLPVLRAVRRFAVMTEEVTLPAQISSVRDLWEIFSLVLVGVYFVVRGDELVYVGKSVNVVARVGGSHHVCTAGDRIFFTPVPAADLLRVEAAFLAAFGARLNGPAYRNVPSSEWAPIVRQFTANFEAPPPCEVSPSPPDPMPRATAIDWDTDRLIGEREAEEIMQLPRGRLAYLRKRSAVPFDFYRICSRIRYRRSTIIDAAARKTCHRGECAA